MKTKQSLRAGLLFLALIAIQAPAFGQTLPGLKKGDKPTRKFSEVPKGLLPPPPKAPLPDLDILHISSYMGLTSAYIKNSGAGPSEQCELFVNAQKKTGSVGTGPPFIMQKTVPPIKAGQFVVVKLGDVAALGAKVDSGKHVTESNEENNTYGSLIPKP